MEKRKIKAFEAALLLALCAALCHGTFLQAEQTELEKNLIRLHVIAHDDSESEQAAKLAVRDAVLEHILPMTESAGSAAEAEAIIRSGLEEIERAASDAAGGRQVQLLFGETGYPTRLAEGCVLPAGYYSSLRVVLGDGQGRNWWGVIFPGLCGFSDEKAADAAKILGEDGFALVCESEGKTLEVRFKILELLKELRDIFKK